MGEKDMIRRGWLSVGAAAMALVLLGASLPARSQEMALPERRALAAYQEKIYPGLEKAIQDAAGFAVPIEVDWPSIVIAGQAQNFAHEGFWTNIFFVPIKDALAAVASDAMGKQALKDKLKKIAITFNEGTAPASNYANGVKFAGGTLSINFRPWSNTGDVKPRAEAIRKVLEAGL
jgi:hypothetical protein